LVDDIDLYIHSPNDPIFFLIFLVVLRILNGYSKKGNPALTKRSKVGQGVLTPGQTPSDPVKDNTAADHDVIGQSYPLFVTAFRRGRGDQRYHPLGFDSHHHRRPLPLQFAHTQSFNYSLHAHDPSVLSF
jgi:hypothetical protein